MTSFFVPNIGFRFKAGVFDDLVDIARDKHNCFIAFYCGWPKKTLLLWTISIWAHDQLRCYPTPIYLVAVTTAL